MLKSTINSVMLYLLLSFSAVFASNESNIIKSIKINNTAPTLSSITLKSNATTVNVGDMVKLSVVGKYSEGSSKAQ